MTAARWLRCSPLVLAVLVACGERSPAVPFAASQEEFVAPEVVVPALVVPHGQTLDVPGTYPRIGDALAVARRGDTVHVEAGYYPECLVLVDGVILDGEPGAMIDGTTCDPAVPAVISADATIKQGAIVRGFHVTGARGPAIALDGSRGVHLLDLLINTLPTSPPHAIFLSGAAGIEVARTRIVSAGGISLHGSSAVLSDLVILNNPAHGVRSSGSDFVLVRSTLHYNQGNASVLVMQGSRAVLEDNDILGWTTGVAVWPGLVVDEPLWAPSQAWMRRNTIHDGNGIGLHVFGKGSRVLGSDNVFSGNQLSGVHVTGGATYIGRRETMAHNVWDGVVALGCEQRNRLEPDGSITQGAVIEEQSHVVLGDFRLEGNGADGMWAACGAHVNLSRGVVDHHDTGRGIGVAAEWQFPDGTLSHGSTFVQAERTVFSGNRIGVLVLGDAHDVPLPHVVLGTLDEPGMNSFLGNTSKAIRNGSTETVLAQWNWFGTVDPAAIAASIAGPVTFEPFLTTAP